MANIFITCKRCEAVNEFPREMQGKRATCHACLRKIKVVGGSATDDSVREAVRPSRQEQRSAPRRQNELPSHSRVRHVQTESRPAASTRPADADALAAVANVALSSRRTVYRHEDAVTYAATTLDVDDSRTLSPQQKRLQAQRQRRSAQPPAHVNDKPRSKWGWVKLVSLPLTILSLVVGGFTVTVRHVNETRTVTVPRSGGGGGSGVISVTPQMRTSTWPKQTNPLTNLERINEINRRNKERQREHLRRLGVPDPTQNISPHRHSPTRQSGNRTPGYNPRPSYAPPSPGGYPRR